VPTSFEQTLPNSAEAERAILGAVLLDPGLMTQALTVLDPKDFYVPSHRNVFIAMSTLFRSQMEINTILIGEELKRQNALEATGGISFITNLTYGLPHSTNIAHYAKVVRSKTILRNLKKSIAAIDEQIDEGIDETDTILNHASEEIYRLTVESQLEAKSSVRSYAEVAVEALEVFDTWAAGETVSIPTQIPEVDERLSYGGLAAGDLVVIAARTSFGKSALALQIAVSAARAGVPVLIFSLEMPAIRLFFRNVASSSSVPHFQIAPATFQYHPGMADLIRKAVPGVGALPIYVDHTTRKLRRMLALAEDWHRKVSKERKKALIIADYLQLAENKLNKRTRNEEVAEVSKEFKSLAARLEIPLVAVSQLNRASSKDNRRPELPDLRESGQIEQDADLVLFPWSKDATLSQERMRSLEIYCPKQRGGKTGWEVPIDFDGDKQWFYTARMYAQERGEVAPPIDFND
jgi:replicative DNA helicase